MELPLCSAPGLSAAPVRSLELETQTKHTSPRPSGLFSILGRDLLVFYHLNFVGVGTGAKGLGEAEQGPTTLWLRDGGSLGKAQHPSALTLPQLQGKWQDGG